MKTALEDLAELVAIPSFSGCEDVAADWMEERLTQEGIEPCRLFNNVWAFAAGFDPELPTVLLNSHLDTVAVCKGWEYEPHRLTQVDNRCFGLGINDAGAGLIALLHVFLRESTDRKSGKKPVYNLVFLASAEEENSGKNGMELVREALGKIDMAIVGEPTGGAVAIAEKGLLVLDGIATGVAGHAARNTGTNALYLALDDIQRIKSYSFTKLSAFLGETKATVTAIHSGDLHNVIPDECRFTVDVRLNEHYTHEEVLSELQQISVAELIPRSMRLCPSGLPENHSLKRSAEKLDLNCFGSPTMSDQALMPWPSVKMGPGESERSHTANEFIYVEELENGIRLYRNFLQQLEYEIMG